MKKWRTQVELRYQWEDSCEETHYEFEKFVLGVFDYEGDAYSIANEFYDKTKHLYKYPLGCRFGEHYAGSKKNIYILKIPEIYTRTNTSDVSVIVTITPMNFTEIDGVIEHLEQGILKRK